MVVRKGGRAASPLGDFLQQIEWRPPAVLQPIGHDACGRTRRIAEATLGMVEPFEIDHVDPKDTRCPDHEQLAAACLESRRTAAPNASAASISLPPVPCTR